MVLGAGVVGRTGLVFFVLGIIKGLRIYLVLISYLFMYLCIIYLFTLNQIGQQSGTGHGMDGYQNQKGQIW